MLETMISVGILSLVLIVILALFTTMLRIWASGSSGVSSNTYASLAMRKLVLEMQEGRSASILNGGEKLVVVFPYRSSSNSDYNKKVTGDTVTFYLSGDTGSESTGTNLWKLVGTTKTKLAKNITAITEPSTIPMFAVENGKMVRIAIRGADPTGNAINPNEIRQSVKLRNN